MKLATTIQEQIQLLQNRGMEISDIQKAGEILSDIGYYRLGFYWFPMEKNVKGVRNHLFKQGTRFESAVELYYFDNDLRKLLLPYILRVEVDFRTHLIYLASNQYKNEPTWFVDPRYVNQKYINEFLVTYLDIKKNTIIQKHHRKYPQDTYAPAWKTLEYATFGQITLLYQSLNDKSLQNDLAWQYNIRNLKVFRSYLTTIRYLRNICAHGHTLYDVQLPQSILTGPLELHNDDTHNLVGAIKVLEYLLQSISLNRASDLKSDIVKLLDAASPEISSLVSYLRGII